MSMLRQLAFGQRRLVSCAAVLRTEAGGSSRTKRRSTKTSSSSNKLHSVSLPFEINDASNPRKISEYLDEYVIGQERAKRALAVAVFNHYARVRSILRHSEELDEYSRFLEAEFRRRYANENASIHDHPETADTDVRQHQPPPPPQQSSDRDNNSVSGEIRTVATKKKPTATFDFDFISSGSPSSSRNNDPTQYGHDSLLTDFVGQVSGSPRPLDISTMTLPQKPSPDPMINVEKSNILLVGPTGTGKTLLARTLAKCLDVPFVSVEATPFTQAGYVGEDVESCVQRLVQAAGYDLKKAAVGIIHIDEIDKLSRKQSDGNSKDVSGEGVQQSLLRILEGSMVQVTDKGMSGGMVSGGLGGNGRNPSKDGGLPHNPINGNASGGGKGETYLLDTSNILFILSGAFVGIEKIIRDRIAKGSIGFNAPLKTDSIHKDKNTPKQLSSQDNKDASSHSLSHFFTTNTSESVFSELEPVDLINYGLIPEFVGRLPMLTTLNSLSEADLLRVLTAPRQALVKQYEALFAYYGVELAFTRPALVAIASSAKKHQTGARGLRRLMENILLDPMYTSPQSSIRYVLIDRSVVEGKSHAKYYSRGQQSLFNAAVMEDEQLHPESATLASQVIGFDGPTSSSKDSSRLQSIAA